MPGENANQSGGRGDARVNEFAFAAGADGERVSSTWMVKWNTRVLHKGRGISLDMFIFNVDAGADKGHLSFHGANHRGQDWTAHWKAHTPNGPHRSDAWDWPDALPGSEGTVFRFATVLIPHVSLEAQPPAPVSSLEPILLEPPPEGQQLNVDILLEIGRSDPSDWPGRVGKGTRFVTPRAIALHHANGDLVHVFGRWVLVSHMTPLGRTFAKRELTLPADRDTLEALVGSPRGKPRLVMFGTEDLDDGRVPWLAEFPLAEVRANLSSG